MSLNATILDGATALTPAGGSNITLAPLGIQNGVAKTFVQNDSTMLTRRTVDFSVKDPKANAASPGGMTQARRKVVLSFPKTVTVGPATVLTQEKITIEAGFDIGSDAARIKNLLFLAAQTMSDTEFDAFWQAGSLV